MLVSRTLYRLALVLAAPSTAMGGCASFGTAAEGPDAASTSDASSTPPGLDGAQPPDGGSPDSTTPARPLVDAGGFGVDSTEVSNTDYDRFLSATLDPTFKTAPHPACDANTSFARADGCNGDARSDLPVTCVDWCDAWAYCAWEGKRLCGKIGANELTEGERTDPTRSQWFNACAGLSGQRFPYGTNARVDACVTKDNGDAGLRPSGSTATCEGRPKGVFDMVGNVSEWEDSCGTGGAPQDNTCATRGGSISDNAATATCSFIATAKRTDVRSTLGFRCCSR